MSTLTLPARFSIGAERVLTVDDQLKCAFSVPNGPSADIAFESALGVLNIDDATALLAAAEAVAGLCAEKLVADTGKVTHDFVGRTADEFAADVELLFMLSGRAALIEADVDHLRKLIAAAFHGRKILDARIAAESVKSR